MFYICIDIHICVFIFVYMHVHICIYTHTNIYGILRWVRTRESKSHLRDLIEKEVLVWLPYQAPQYKPFCLLENIVNFLAKASFSYVPMGLFLTSGGV